jgi:hypothetical protein
MACLSLIDSTKEKCSLGKKSKTIKILIFTEGTILGPKTIFRHFNHASYSPIKNAVSIIESWEEQGAEIIYVTSRKKYTQILEIKELLLKYHFPGESLYYRGKKQKYKDIVESVLPNILIEDDCRSIGGKWQMCITYIKPEIKRNIKFIVVKEFKGIDDLGSICH